MRIGFDFTDLEAFLAVVETGAFQRAAQSLGVSQSSVTRRIQKLEAALDVTLFQRSTRDVQLTLAAKRLKVRAEAILNDTKETTRAMRDESAAFAHQMSRSLTIAAVPTVIPGLVAPVLRQLSHEVPHARFRILDHAANEVAEAVAQGEADVGLCSVPAFEPWARFERLFDDAVVIAFPRGHALGEMDVLTWADVSDEDLILPSRGTGNRMLIDDALARAGVPLVWKMEVGRTTTALACVAAGLGVAPLPQSAVGAGRCADVAFRPVSSPSIARPIGILTRNGTVPNALADRLCVMLRAAGPAV